MDTFTMTIDGKSRPGSRRVGVINPATGKAFAEVPDCTKAELDEAMEAARRAFPAWSRDEALRRKVLNDCAAALQANAERIAPLLTQEQGKPLAKAGEEIMGASIWFQYTASLEIPVEVVQDDEARRVEIRRKPLGVVAAITPWTFTPLNTVLLGEILRDVVPPGVVNVVSGGDELGSWMTSHPVPRKISFTGSVATGKKVAGAAAQDLKRVTLELGGNDAAILLPDIDPKAIAAKVFWGAFENNGQICSAIKRVYVHEKQ